MTEIPDISALFGPPPQISPEAQRAQDEFADHQYAEMLKAFAQMQFFAPILCSCARRYIWGDPAPSQAGCIIHGSIQLGKDGRVMVFDRPPEPHKER